VKNRWPLLLALVLVGVASRFLFQESAADRDDSSQSTIVAAPTKSESTAVDRAFENRTSNVQVEGQGTVSKVLKDDNEGSRHQRFILMLASGRTLLVAHNIDLAPRIDELAEGDVVKFNGEYEWNSKGGVLHWTHHDPERRHVGGWLEHRGEALRMSSA